MKRQLTMQVNTAIREIEEFMLLVRPENKAHKHIYQLTSEEAERLEAVGDEALDVLNRLKDRI